MKEHSKHHKGKRDPKGSLETGALEGDKVVFQTDERDRLPTFIIGKREADRSNNREQNKYAKAQETGQQKGQHISHTIVFDE